MTVAKNGLSAPGSAPAAYGELDLREEADSYESFLTRCGKGAAACTCSAAGAGILSHVGCLVAPAAAFAGVAGGASVSAVSLGASALLTAAGLGVWYKTRWKEAGPLERRLTIAGAFAGAAMAAGLHLSGVSGHGHAMDEALKWYQSQPESARAEIRENAKLSRIPLNDYVLEICGPEQARTGTSERTAGKAFRSFLGLDK